MDRLPEGFSEAPPPAMEAPNTAPEGFTSSAPLPPGFSATPPPPPAPEGFSYENPIVPATGDPVEKSNTQTPGFWGSMGSAFGRGLTQNIADAVAGGRVALPPGQGGQTLEEQFQSGVLHPETKDEIDALMQRKIFSGWSDPKWWGVNIAHGVGSMTPAIGAGAVGALAGPVGAIGGFASESALSSLVPAYKAARAAGLNPEAATHRALVDSGISVAAAAAMGLAPGVSLFGRAVGGEGVDVVAGAMNRPVMETLAQLGIVQPLIGDTQHLTTALTHGEIPGTEDLLTNHALGTAMGAVPVGAHAAFRATRGFTAGPPEAPASPEVIHDAFKEQQTAPVPIALPPEQSAAEETLYPPPSKESRIFYSAVRQAIEQKVPDNATPEQVVATIKNHPGVKEEEILDLGLPGYLASLSGRVNKADLVAHVEANGLVLEEAQAGNPIEPPEVKAVYAINDEMMQKYGGLQEFFDEGTPQEIVRWTEAHAIASGKYPPENTGRQPEYPNQVLPGEHSNYREFVLKVPARSPPLGMEEAFNIVKNDLPRQKQEDYTNAHWPEDVNPIAHFRISDRSDRDGRNLLHVEELQSDLHQEGAKTGYKDPTVPSVEEAKKALYALNREHDEFAQRNESPGEISFAQSERFKVMPEYQALIAKRKPAWDLYTRALENAGKVPDLPFKTSWRELGVKRILRLAADEGYDGVSWSNGDQVGLRLGTPEQLKGARYNYDKVLPSLFKKWANKLGTNLGETKLDGISLDDFHPIHEMRLRQMGLDPSTMNDRNYFVEVNPAFSERAKMGFSLYEEGARRKHTLSEAFTKGNPKELAGPSKKLIAALGKLAKDMTISLPVKIVVRPTASTWRGHAYMRNGQYEIHVNTRLLRSAEDIWATMGHELGHVVYWDKYALAPLDVRLGVEERFRQFRLQMNTDARTVGDVRRVRDNAVSEMTGARNPLHGDLYQNDIPLSDLAPGSRAYILHFKEWFAEQGAKWATSSEKPLSRVDRFFAEVGKSIRALLEKFQILRGRSGKAEDVLQGWLDSLVTEDTDVLSTIKDQTALEGLRMNQDALSRDGTPQITPTVATASTVGGRNIINALPPGDSGAGRAGAAHADRMNKFYEWMTSLPQIAELNKHIRGLVQYKETVAVMNLEKNNIMGDPWETLRGWKAIRDPKQQIGIGKFIDDYINGFFKDPSDQSGDVRRPTEKEFTALVRKHELSDSSVRLFKKLTSDFDGFLEKYRQLLLEDANRIQDPLAQMTARDSINRRVDAILQRPYFPAMRFGKYTITVYDSAGNVRHFEQTESLRKQRKIAEALGKSTDLLPGDRVRVGEVPKDAAPLLGMPPGLLDLMADKLSLSDTQKGMLDQLRFDYAPSQSFRHQFKQKDLTPGYSTDFQRAYAHFFFHGANHFTRVKWIDKLRDHIREVKAESLEMNGAVKRDQIANYMTQHLSMLMDPKPDFAALRGLMFHWYLGFNPASATLNLSQTIMMTYPHLASKFGGVGIGDLKAMRALARASTDLNSFYKKGNLVEAGKNAPPGGRGALTRALAEAVNEGVVSETQAHTLAAVSEDRNLFKAFGSKAEEKWQRFSEASSWMFEMTEQYNRRVAFRAAWDLAMRDPNNKYVSETVRDNPLQYKRLMDSGWTHQEAAAFTAAKHSVEATQFVYAPYSRPKFMWGRKGALFIFKSFTQNTLFNLYNNPAGAARTLLILGALGGLMGLPGAEDINGILKSLAWRLFGKDFDLEDEARKFAVDVLHGAIGPDMLLHGMSTKGFGIPHVMNAIGAQVGLPKIFPTVDRHGSVGMGNILPFEPGKLFGPSKDLKTNELAQVQRASGAGFSNIFAMYNFLTSQSSLSDLKRWEMIMPRAASNVSHAWRYYQEGMERNKAGNSVVKFDVNDTEHMAEILARAAGYQPRRLIAAYEAIQGKQEQATYWDLRKGILLRQFGVALKGGNLEEKASVLQSIRNYNQELPAEAKAKSITALVLKESVMSRMRTSVKQEAGLPTSKQNYQMFKNMDKYFPEGRPTGLVNVKPVK